MITRFDHAVLAVDDLPAASALLSDSLGLSVHAGGRHTGFGTENAEIRFGLDSLQISGIYDRGEVAAAGIKRGPMLSLLAERRGGWLAYGMATDDIDALAERCRQVGLDAFGPYAMRRIRPDGRVLKWRLLQPGGTALRRPWPFFIQWDLPDRELLCVEPPRPGGSRLWARHELGATGVTGVAVIVSDLKAAGYMYEDLLGFRMGETAVHETPGAVSTRYWMGSFCVELVAPTSPGPVSARLERQGEGLCEVRLGVENLEAARSTLEGRGVTVVMRDGNTAEVRVEGIEDFGAHIRLEQKAR